MYHINTIEKYRVTVSARLRKILNDLDDGAILLSRDYRFEVYEGDNLIEPSRNLQPGANDVWVVKRKGKRDLLYPTSTSGLNVDIPNKRVDVDILEG